MVVHISLNPSRYLAVVLAIAHLAAGATLITLQLGVEAKMALAVAIVVSLARSLWHHAWLKSRRSIIVLDLHDRENGNVQLRDGTWCDARVLGTTYISASLTAINLRLAGDFRARHIMVLPDTADADEFRKLRVMLRWCYAKEPDRHVSGEAANIG